MTLELSLLYIVDSTLLMTADEFKMNFFSGMPLESFEKYQITNQSIEQNILRQQTYVENMLEIKLAKRILVESSDYEKYRFWNWGFIPYFYNIHSIIKLESYLNESKLADIEFSMIATKKGVDQFRNLYFVAPNFTSLLFQNTLLYTYLYSDYLPNLWRLTYISGYDEIPYDIFDYAGKRVAYDMYNKIGNILLPFGIASNSKSIDGLSQSTSLTRSANTHLFSAAQKSLQEEFKITEPELRMKYKGITVVRS